MTQISFPASSLLLGFGGIEQALDGIARKQADGYPPYNIERLPPADDAAEKLRITLAVAGFAVDELDISVQANQLTISGKQNNDKARTYLHRGIATRQFQRIFVLAEGVHVLSAELENGLLVIELERPKIEQSLRKIGIVQKD